MTARSRRTARRTAVAWALLALATLLAAQTVWILVDRDEGWAWDLAKSAVFLVVCLAAALGSRRPS